MGNETGFSVFASDGNAAGLPAFVFAGTAAGTFVAAGGWGLDFLTSEAEVIQTELIKSNPMNIIIELALTSRKAFLDVWLDLVDRASLETIAELLVFIGFSVMTLGRG